MKLNKAYASKETVLIELSFEELTLITDMIADVEGYEDNDLYDTILDDFTKLSTDVIILDNAMRQVGIK